MAGSFLSRSSVLTMRTENLFKQRQQPDIFSGPTLGFVVVLMKHANITEAHILTLDCTSEMIFIVDAIKDGEEKSLHASKSSFTTNFIRCINTIENVAQT